MSLRARGQFSKRVLISLSGILMTVPIAMRAQEQRFPAPSTTGILGAKDAGALSEVKAHLLASSAAGWQSLEGTGTITFSDGASHPASLYLTGSRSCRLDIEMASGIRSLRISGLVGKSQDERGTQGALTPATSSAGIVAFPRVWTDALASANVSLYDHKIYSGTGENLHRITIEHPLDIEVTNSLGKKTAASDLYFDPNSHLLLFSVESLSFTGMRSPLIRVTTYSNYQSFQGVSVPATIKQTLNGQIQWTLSLSQVTLNPNLPTSTFTF
jgi:hypothetical protein